MEKLKKLLKPKLKPQEVVRDWQRKILQECRNIDRQIRDILREQKTVNQAILDSVKRNDMDLAKGLAKKIIMSRKTVNRLHENKAQLNSISMHLGESVAMFRTVGHLSKSAEVMKLVNKLMKVPEMAVTSIWQRDEKGGVIEEFVTEGLDSVLDTEDTEEETEEEIEKVLTAIACEIAAQLPEPVRKKKVKQDTQPAMEKEPIAEGADDDEEDIEGIRAQLAKIGS